MTRSSSKAKAAVFNRQIPMHLVRQFSSEVERLPTVPTQEIEQIRGGGVRHVPMVAQRKVQPAERAECAECTAEMLEALAEPIARRIRATLFTGERDCSA